MKLLRAMLFAVVAIGAAPLVQARDVMMSEVVPWSHPDDKGGYDGINVRILQALVQKTGLDLKPNILPTARMLVSFRGAADAYAISFATNLTDQDGPVVSPLKTYPIVVWLRKGADANNYEALAKLGGEGVSVLRGLKYEPLSSDERIKKVEESSLDIAVKKVAAGRVAGVVGSEPALQTYAKRMKLEGELGNRIQISTSDFVIRARPGVPPEERAKVAKALQEMQKDGTIDKIVADYLARQ